ELAPDAAARGRAVGESQCDLVAGGERMKVDHVEAENVEKRLGVTAEADMVRFVDDPAEERHQQDTARVDKALDGRRAVVSHQVEARGQDETVGGEIV